MDPLGLKEKRIYGQGNLVGLNNIGGNISRQANLFLNLLYSEFNNSENAKYSKTWDTNQDNKLQKSEADYWRLYGNGEPISVDNTYINWDGLTIPENKKIGDVFNINTTEAFINLPRETASTYGGTIFQRIGTEIVRVIDQSYHYNYRENDNWENLRRNIMTWVGKPAGEGTDYMIYYYNSVIGVK